MTVWLVSAAACRVFAAPAASSAGSVHDDDAAPYSPENLVRTIPSSATGRPEAAAIAVPAAATGNGTPYSTSSLTRPIRSPSAVTIESDSRRMLKPTLRTISCRRSTERSVRTSSTWIVRKCGNSSPSCPSGTIASSVLPASRIRVRSIATSANTRKVAIATIAAAQATRNQNNPGPASRASTKGTAAMNAATATSKTATKATRTQPAVA